jgi:glycosyltransferase involved in cell wall biosynthesis
MAHGEAEKQSLEKVHGTKAEFAAIGRSGTRGGVRMKKVAHICTTALSHKILVDKLTLLQHKGYQIHIISDQEGYDAELMEQYEFVTRFVKMDRSIHPFRDIRSIIQLYRLLKREKYEIVHTHTAKAGIIGRIAAKWAKIPLIIHTSHGLPFYQGQSKIKNFMYKALEKIGSFFCDAIASQNKEDMEALKKIAPNKKVYYEGNGVDLRALDAIHAQITEHDLIKMRQDLGISESTVILLKAARFEPVKDHFTLLKSLQILEHEYGSDIICLLAGKGPLEEDIQYEINHLNIHVKLIGYKTNLYPYIKLADIVTLTSEKEGIPRIIMEAMAFSKPVVATDVLGTRELVIDQKTGYLVPFQDEERLAAQLHALIQDAQKRKLLGAHARAVIEAEFTEDIVVNRMDDLYKMVGEKQSKNITEYSVNN